MHFIPKLCAYLKRKITSSDQLVWYQILDMGHFICLCNFRNKRGLPRLSFFFEIMCLYAKLSFFFRSAQQRIMQSSIMYLYFHPATVLSCRLTFGRSVAKHSFFQTGLFTEQRSRTQRKQTKGGLVTAVRRV